MKFNHLPPRGCSDCPLEEPPREPRAPVATLRFLEPLGRPRPLLWNSPLGALVGDQDTGLGPMITGSGSSGDELSSAA